MSQSLVSLKESKSKPLIPFEHQQVVLKSLKEAVRNGQTNLMVYMASALGKTLLACFFVKWLLGKKGNLRNRNSRVLVLCHQNEILDQFCLALKTVLGIKLFSYGYCFGGIKNLEERIVLANFGTMKGLLSAFKPEAFDLIIVDECHHSMAETYYQSLAYFKPKYLLGLTATPFRSDKKDLNTLYSYQVVQFSLRDALEQKLLVEVQYYALADNVEPRKITGVLENMKKGIKYKISQLNRLFFVKQRDEEVRQQIEKFVDEHKIINPKIIIFAPTIRYANYLGGLMPKAFVIHTDVSPKVQKARLEAFKAALSGILICVNKFDEGVDIPECNVIAFMRATKSPRVFLQQLGRGLRKALGKDVVYILDFVTNCERVSLLYRYAGNVIPVLVKGKKKGAPELEIFDTPQISFSFSKQLEDVFSILSRITPIVTKEKLIEELHALARELNKKTPTTQDLIRAELAGTFSGARYIYRFFGDFHSFLIAAGMSFPRTVPKHKHVIELLEYLAKQLKRLPDTEDIAEFHKSNAGLSVNLIDSKFGSLDNAYVVAGYIPGSILPNLTLEQARQKYLELEKTLGCTPKLIQVIEAYKEGGFTKDDLGFFLWALAKKLARPPGSAIIERYAKLGLMPSIKQYKTKVNFNMTDIRRVFNMEHKTDNFWRRVKNSDNEYILKTLGLDVKVKSK